MKRGKQGFQGTRKSLFCVQNLMPRRCHFWSRRAHQVPARLHELHAIDPKPQAIRPRLHDTRPALPDARHLQQAKPAPSPTHVDLAQPSKHPMLSLRPAVRGKTSRAGVALGDMPLRPSMIHSGSAARFRPSSKSLQPTGRNAASVSLFLVGGSILCVHCENGGQNDATAG